MRLLIMAASALAFFVVGLPGPSALHAQSFLGAEPLSVSLSPKYPRPYDTVTLIPSSNLFDLSGTTITFFVNGTQIGTQTGGGSVDFQMKGPGESMTVRITAKNTSGSYEKTLVIRPANVVLVTEPISTGHPFYKGANLPASEGRVRLVALADLRTDPTHQVSPENLVYTWKIGDQQLLAESGIGHSSITVAAPIRYRSENVSVTVATQDGSIAGASGVTLTPVNPIIRLYAEDPLAGPLYDFALGDSLAMTDTELTLRVVPYFFPEAPSLAWSMNGEQSGTTGSLTLRQTGSAAGNARISVVATGSSFFSTGSTATLINFGKSGNSGIFGL